MDYSENSVITLKVNGVNDAPTVEVAPEKIVLSENDFLNLAGYVNSYHIITEAAMFELMGVQDVDSNELSLSLVTDSSKFKLNGVDVTSSVNGVIQLTQDDIDAFGLVGKANVGDFFIYSTEFDALNKTDDVKVTFKVKAFDGMDYSENSVITLKVNGVNDAPIIMATTEVDGTYVNMTIPNTYSSDIIVADINAKDVDDDILTYSIVVNPLDDSQYLSINSTTGVVTFTNEAAYNAANHSALNFQVKVSDANGGDAIYSIQSGTGIDGYIVNMTVFSDIDGNKNLDLGEASDLTNNKGEFTLSGTDLSGTIIGYGGIDISTGLDFEGIYKAPAGSSVLNPITTLLVNLMNEGKDINQAKTIIKDDFGIDVSVDLLADPISQALSSTATITQQTNYAALQMLSTKIDNTVGQIAAAIEGANITDERNAFDVVSQELAKLLNAGTVNLDNATFIDTLITNSLIVLGGTLNTNTQADLVDIILNINTAITQAVATSTTPLESFESLAKVQIAAETIENELEAAVGGDTSGVVASSSGAIFAAKVAIAEVGLISKAQASINHTPTVKDILIERIEDQLDNTSKNNTTLTVGVDSNIALSKFTSDLDVLDTHTFQRSGTKLGLTIVNTSPGLLDAVINNNIEYIRDIALKIASIPEITTVLGSITDVNMLMLINQLKSATTVPQLLTMLNSINGVTVGIDTVTGALKLEIADAKILETTNLLNIQVNENGSYSVDSSLFNSLGKADIVNLRFDYVAKDSTDLVSEPKTVILSISGSNDTPTLENVTIDLIEDQLTNTTLSVGIDSNFALSNFTKDIDVTDDFSFQRSGTKLGLTIVNTSPGLLDAVVNNNIEYIRDIALKIASIPEITTVLGSITDVNMLMLINQLKSATTVPQLLTMLNSINGVTVGIDTVTGALKLEIADAKILETTNLLNIDINTAGSYTVESTLFNNLGKADSISLSFDYIAIDSGYSGGATAIPKTITVNIAGSNDAPTIQNVTVPAVSEDSLVNGTKLEIGIASQYALNNFANDADVTDNFYFERANSDKLGLSFTTTDPELFAAFKTNNLDYIKNVVVELISIPEIAIVFGSITEPSILMLINQLKSATSVPQLLGMVNSISGVNLGVDLSTNTLKLDVTDASILESKGLLTILVDGSGSYTVESALFNNMSINDSVSLNFNYIAIDSGYSGGPTVEAKTITLTITGSNDAPTVTATPELVLSETDFGKLSVYENSYKIITEIEMYGLMGVEDVDVNDNLTLSLVSESSNFTSLNTGVLNSNSGVIQLTQDDIDYFGLINVNVGDFFIYSTGFNGLGDAEVATATFVVNVSDGIATTSSTINLTINGVNDAPTASVSSSIVSNDNVSYVGQLVANDVDINDTLTYTYDKNSVTMTLSLTGLNNLDSLLALNNPIVIQALNEIKTVGLTFVNTGNILALTTLSSSTIVAAKVVVSTLQDFLDSNSGLKNDIVALKDFISANKASIIANTSLIAEDIVLLETLLTPANITALGNLFNTLEMFVTNPVAQAIVQNILADNVIAPSELALLAPIAPQIQLLRSEIGILLAANPTVIGLLDIPTIISKLDEVVDIDTLKGEITATVDVPSSIANLMIDLDANTGEYTVTNPYLSSLPDNTQVEVNFNYTVEDSAGAMDSSTAAMLITTANVNEMNVSINDGVLMIGEDHNIDMASLLSNATSNLNASDIDSIDLSNSEHILSNITKADFEAMVSDDSSNTLAITGENDDIVKLDLSIWTRNESDTDINSVVDNADDHFISYTTVGSHNQVLTLLIDKDITVENI
jgi:VCBS repeat-containing protein